MDKKSPHISGSEGEDRAVQFLMNKGYKILARNYRTRTGEIDIIAYFKGIYIFTEVKKRSSSSYGFGYEAVDRKKRDHILKAAGIYMSEKGGEKPCRFDIISIDGTNIIHIENAFSL